MSADPNDEAMKLMFQATIANVKRAGPLKERTKSKGKDPKSKSKHKKAKKSKDQGAQTEAKGVTLKNKNTESEDEAARTNITQSIKPQSQAPTPRAPECNNSPNQAHPETDLPGASESLSNFLQNLCLEQKPDATEALEW